MLTIEQNYSSADYRLKKTLSMVHQNMKNLVKIISKRNKKKLEKKEWQKNKENQKE